MTNTEALPCFGGRYRAEAVLGGTFSGVVYRGREIALGRQVAVKWADAALAREPVFRRRFEREARILASLDHPHIVPIYAVGEHAGRPYFVMKFIPGSDLAARADEVGEPLRLLRRLRPVFAALDFAHARGVVHRDLKPENIRVTAEGVPVLIDFGISLADWQGDPAEAGPIVGTPYYMAPELALEERPSPSSDLYALAVIVFELLAGRPPFLGDTPVTVAFQHATRPPPALSTLREALPKALDLVLHRALAKNPQRRYRSCLAFYEAVERALEGGPARPPSDHPVAVSELRNPVTSLPGGLIFLDRLRGAVERARRHERQFAVACVGVVGVPPPSDPDHRAILRQVAWRLRSALRGVDTVAHLGDDVFGVIVDEVEGVDDALIPVTRAVDGLMTDFARPHTAEPVSVAACGGLSMFPSHELSPEPLLEAAREAMAAAMGTAMGACRIYAP